MSEPTTPATSDPRRDVIDGIVQLVSTYASELHSQAVKDGLARARQRRAAESKDQGMPPALEAKPGS